jgi:hypothetical protein
MLRVTLSTPLVLDRLNRETRPYNFLFCSLIDPVVGYPAGVDRDRFTVIAPFTKRSTGWLQLPCVNVHDGRAYRLALRQTSALDRVIPQTFASILRLYLTHHEAKSLAPDATPCDAQTRGLLRRASIAAGEHRPILKETDRRSEHGEAVTILDPRMAEISPTNDRSERGTEGKDARVRDAPAHAKTDLSQHTLEKILAGRPVRPITLQRPIAAIGR